MVWHGRRSVFDVDAKLHAGHMKAVKQSVLDGTSKWSAKLAITGCHILQYIHLLTTQQSVCQLLSDVYRVVYMF